MNSSNSLLVFLSGHIHGPEIGQDWRAKICQLSKTRNLPVTFKGPCEDHHRSDNIGVQTRGISENEVGSPTYFSVVQDDLGGRINALRNGIWISKCDLLIAFFDDKNYRQWNTSSDIGEAARHGKPVIVVHDPKFRHPLKELNGRTDAVVGSLEKAVDILSYICEK